MQSIEQSGRTVEDAVNAALKTLGASRDEVEVEVLAEKSRGLLGILGHSEAKVRVTRRAGLAEHAAEITREILRFMEVEATVTIDADSPEGVEISIDAETDLGLLIGKRGQCLAALQLIVAMMANRQLDPESRRRVSSMLAATASAENAPSRRWPTAPPAVPTAPDSRSVWSL